MDLKGAKVGDLLYIEGRYGAIGRLARIDRITPAGRVRCGKEQFNSDGFIRGGDRWSRTLARIATDADIARVTHSELISRIRRQIERQWSIFTRDELNAIAAISDAVAARTTESR